MSRATPITFKKAVKEQLKLRLAIDGPSGAGKTFTSLIAATAIGGRILVIDSERGKSRLYADKFNFDIYELEDFAPATYVKVIHAAEAAGYDVIVIDSLSHAWSGKGGALEMVDNAAARSQSRNSYTAWREVTPQHNAMVDAMLMSPAHIIVTMRTKTEYVLEEDDKGKKVPRKIGMAPIQRDGLEYEFDVVGDMDHEKRFIVSKTRYDAIDGAVVKKPDAKWFGQIVAWLNDGSTPSAAPEAETTAAAAPAATTSAPAAAGRQDRRVAAKDAQDLGEAKARVLRLLASKFGDDKPAKALAIKTWLGAEKPWKDLTLDDVLKIESNLMLPSEDPAGQTIDGTAEHVPDDEAPPWPEEESI